MNQQAPFLVQYQSIIGSVLGVFLSVLVIEILLPLIRKRKKEAEEKLKNFYNTAYAFVKMRESFSIAINGKVHNKENCGEFHSFLDNNQVSGNILFEERAFFDFVANNFAYVDSDLKVLFIRYFSVRGPETVQTKLGCENSKMIELRQVIEKKIIEQYEHYKKISGI